MDLYDNINLKESKFSKYHGHKKKYDGHGKDSCNVCHLYSLEVDISQCN